MSKNARRIWVHPDFAKIIDEKSHDMGMSRIRLTQKMAEGDVIDEEAYNKRLWGIFYKPKRR